MPTSLRSARCRCLVADTVFRYCREGGPATPRPLLRYLSDTQLGTQFGLRTATRTAGDRHLHPDFAGVLDLSEWKQRFCRKDRLTAVARHLSLTLVTGNLAPVDALITCPGGAWIDPFASSHKPASRPQQEVHSERSSPDHRQHGVQYCAGCQGPSTAGRIGCAHSSGNFLLPAAKMSGRQ